VSGRLLAARELAEYLGLSAGTILDWHESGRIPSFKLGPGPVGPVRFRLSEVEAWLESCRTLRPDELGAWRLTLSEGSRHDVFRALRQVLEQAERWQWIDRNPARYVKNPKPKRPEIQPFGSWDEVDLIAAELDPRFAAIPVFAAGTGLRPEEWIALDVAISTVAAGVVTIERVYSQGRLKPAPRRVGSEGASRCASAS
jgi:excisionase family DNA binding protein